MTLFHAYGTGPRTRGAGPRARSKGMEQRLGRKSKGFWKVWNKIPAGGPRGEVLGRTHMDRSGFLSLRRAKGLENKASKA